MSELQTVNHSEIDQPTRRDVVRVIGNLPVPVFDALEDLAISRDTSMTEQIRQALRSEVFLDEEISNGAKLIRVDREGNEWEVVIPHMSDKRNRLQRLKSNIVGIVRF